MPSIKLLGHGSSIARLLRASRTRKETEIKETEKNNGAPSIAHQASAGSRDRTVSPQSAHSGANAAGSRSMEAQRASNEPASSPNSGQMPTTSLATTQSRLTVSDTTNKLPTTTKLDHNEQSGIVTNDSKALEKNDMRSTAFRKACVNRSEDEQRQLTAPSGIAALFKELQELDENHREESMFRKGLRLVRPAVKGVDQLVGIATPITSFEPAAAGALAIVKSVATIAVAICGTEAKLQGNIEKLLSKIPLIDRCDEIVTEGPLPDIEKQLILLYGDLLDFYFAAASLLQSAHFGVDLAISAFKASLMEPIDSFTEHITTLGPLIEVEILKITRTVSDHQLDDMIRRRLNVDTSYMSEREEFCESRNDDACKWIDSKEHYLAWQESGSATNWISLTGSMGSGKSVMVQHVVDTLRRSVMKPIVCAHYCRDDGNTGQARSVLCNFLWRLLTRIPGLKLQFDKWYSSSDSGCDGDATRDISRLGIFVDDCLSSVQQPVFLVVDGLDECNQIAQKELFRFIGRVHSNHPQHKIFVCHRTDDSLQDRMPRGSATIPLKSSKSRDRLIVQHWVDFYLDDRKDELKDVVSQDLAVKAEGSAIWIRLVAEYLSNSKIRNPDLMKKELKNMPPPKRLKEIYVKLFHQATDDEEDNKVILAQILTLLAGALGPLTADAVAQAVVLASPGVDETKSLKQVAHESDAERVLLLSKSFIRRAGETDGAILIGLVHQSLNEYIQKSPPKQWNEPPKVILSPDFTWDANFLLAKISVQYLLLYFRSQGDPGSGTESLNSSSTLDPVPLRDHSSPHLPLRRSGTAGSEGLGLGFVGNFFDQLDLAASSSTAPMDCLQVLHLYASKYWTEHYLRCQSLDSAGLRRCVLELYNCMSPPDWEHHFSDVEDRRPGEHPAGGGILAIASFYGHQNVVQQICEGMKPDMAHIAKAIYWSSHQGRLACLEILLRHVGDIDIDCSCNGLSPLAAAAKNGHVETVKHLLDTGKYDINGQDRSGRTPLSLAVEGNHTQVTCELLDARHRSSLEINRPDRRGRTPLFWAVGQTTSQVLRLLIKDSRTKLDVQDADQRDAISWACEEGLNEAVTRLASRGAPLESRDRRGNTLLIHAVKSKSYATVFALLSAAESKGEIGLAVLCVDAVDSSEGRHAHSWAACARDSRILQELLRVAPGLACKEDPNGWGPLAWSLNDPAYTENARLLLPFCKDQLSGVAGVDMFELALRWRQLEIARLIAAQPQFAVDLPGSTGQVPVMLAIDRENLDLAKFLVEEKKADVTITDHQGFTPVAYARERGFHDLAIYLDNIRIAGNAVSGAQQDINANDRQPS